MTLTLKRREFVRPSRTPVRRRRQSPEWLAGIQARTRSGEVPLTPGQADELQQALGLTESRVLPADVGTYMVVTKGDGEVRSMFHPNRPVAVRVDRDPEGELGVLYFDYEGLGPAKHWPLSAGDFDGARWVGPL